MWIQIPIANKEKEREQRMRLNINTTYSTPGEAMQSRLYHKVDSCGMKIWHLTGCVLLRTCADASIFIHEKNQSWVGNWNQRRNMGERWQFSPNGGNRRNTRGQHLGTSLIGWPAAQIFCFLPFCFDPNLIILFHCPSVLFEYSDNTPERQSTPIHISSSYRGCTSYFFLECGVCPDPRKTPHKHYGVHSTPYIRSIHTCHWPSTLAWADLHSTKITLYIVCTSIPRWVGGWAEDLQMDNNAKLSPKILTSLNYNEAWFAATNFSEFPSQWKYTTLRILLRSTLQVPRNLGTPQWMS